MNANINYLGLINLLQNLMEQGLISRTEGRKIAACLKARTGADIVLFL